MDKSPHCRRRAVFSFIASKAFCIELRIDSARARSKPASMSSIFVVRMPRSRLGVPGTFSPGKSNVGSVFGIGCGSLIDFSTIIFGH